MSLCGYGDVCCPSGVTPCSGIPKYGPMCYKHRRVYLVEEDLIRMERFTGQRKDYLVKDLKVFHETMMGGKPMKPTKKGDLFAKVAPWIQRVNLHRADYQMERLSGSVPSVVTLQSLVRGRIQRKKGVFVACNNEEDFFTFEPVMEISPELVFSYVDKRGIRWGFDIRSFAKLIEMKYPNPYTMEPIPPDIIRDMTVRLETLKATEGYTDILDEVVRDRTQGLKQQTVDLFANIEQAGYPCQIEWFLGLSRRRLKDLYRQLEDIWNYRAHLSSEAKRRLCPPDGRVFTVPVQDVQSYTHTIEVQALILDNVNRFNRAVDPGDKKVGYMYFIIGLGKVSQGCYEAHQDWLAFIE